MTEATNEKPTRRLMRDREGKTLVVELSRGMVTIRPLGTRRGGRQEAELEIGLAYLQAMRAKLGVAAPKPRKGAR